MGGGGGGGGGENQWKFRVHVCAQGTCKESKESMLPDLMSE